MVAVKDYGRSIKFAGKMMQDDKDVCLESIRNNYGNLEYSSTRLKNDQDVAMQCLKQVGGECLSILGEAIRNDKEFVIIALKSSPMSLLFVSDELKEDKDVVLTAVRANPMSLKYAGSKMKNSVEVVMEAVQKNGLSLEHAGKSVRNNLDVVIAAAKNSRKALQFAEEELRHSSLFLESIRNHSGDIERSLNFMDGEGYSKHLSPVDVQFSGIVMESLESELSMGSVCNYFGEEKIDIDREIQEIQDLKRLLSQKRFKDFEFYRNLGNGNYARTYLTRIEGLESLSVFVTKLYKDLYMSLRMRRSMVKKDTPEVPYHKNVASLIFHRTDEIIEISKLPDYKIWKKRAVGESFLGGMVLAKHYRRDFYSYLKGRKSLFEISEICYIIRGMLRGVYHLHQNMIVHRDLHPENIFIDEITSRIWIGDFGCALDLRNNPKKFKVHKDDDILYSIFSSGCSLNSISQKLGGCNVYLPPEIIHFEKRVQDYVDYEKCDIFSVGRYIPIMFNHLRHKSVLLRLDQGPRAYQMSRFRYKLSRIGDEYAKEQRRSLLKEFGELFSLGGDMTFYVRQEKNKIRWYHSEGRINFAKALHKVDKLKNECNDPNDEVGRVLKAYDCMDPK